nr:hypothetical protein [Corynebacterium ihumii]
MSCRRCTAATTSNCPTDAQRALVTMCIGGGQGLAAVIEKA